MKDGNDASRKAGQKKTPHFESAYRKSTPGGSHSNTKIRKKSTDSGASRSKSNEVKIVTSGEDKPHPTRSSDEADSKASTSKPKKRVDSIAGPPHKSVDRTANKKTQLDKKSENTPSTSKPRSSRKSEFDKQLDSGPSTSKPRTRRKVVPEKHHRPERIQHSLERKKHAETLKHKRKSPASRERKQHDDARSYVRKKPLKQEPPVTPQEPIKIPKRHTEKSKKPTRDLFEDKSSIIMPSESYTPEVLELANKKRADKYYEGFHSNEEVPEKESSLEYFTSSSYMGLDAKPPIKKKTAPEDLRLSDIPSTLTNLFKPERSRSYGDKYSSRYEDATKEEEEYDPYKYRQIKDTLPYWAVIVHLFKGAIGVGILTLPRCFAEVGMMAGLVMLIGLSVIIWHCMHILFEFQYSICKSLRIPWVSYGTSLDLALQMGPPQFRHFANYGHTMVHLVIILNELGTTCSYIAFVATVVKDSVNSIFQVNVNAYYVMLLLLVPFLAINIASDIKKILLFSLIGDLIFISIIIVVIYYAVIGMPPQISTELFYGIYTMPTAFTDMMFSLEYLGVTITVEAHMKHPEKFISKYGVLNITTVVITMSYLCVAVIGCLRYGTESASIVTDNLPQELLIVKACKLLTGLAVYFSYALHSYIAFSMMWDVFLAKKLEACDCKHTWIIFIRIATVILGYFGAVTLPVLGTFVKMLVSCSFSILGIAFPSLIEICVLHPQYGILKWVLVKNVFLMIVSFAMLLTGVYVSIKSLISSVTKEFGN